MKGVRVKKRASQEDLDSELFQVVQKTARHFVDDIEQLGRRYRRLRVTTDPVRLRWRVESSLMSLVGGHTPAARRKRNHKSFPKRVAVAEWSDWPELSGDELGLKTIRVMPHDEGNYEMLLPDDPDPADVTRMPSLWRRIIQHTIHH